MDYNNLEIAEQRIAEAIALLNDITDEQGYRVLSLVYDQNGYSVQLQTVEFSDSVSYYNSGDL